MKKKSRILVLASGTKTDGGSGFQELVEQSRTDRPILDAEIVGVVSNHANGGVYQKAEILHIPFVHFKPPYDAASHQRLVAEFRADYVMCSGCLWFVRGLDPATTINIHPGPLPDFGGPGKHGHHVHEAVMQAYYRGEVKQSAVTMHFVTETGYDRGPIFFQLPVIIRSDDTPDTLAKRVNEKERAWQSYILNLVIHGHIYLKDNSVHYWNINPTELFF